MLSESTERSDRGEKFPHDQHLPSLQEYVLIAQDTRRVEVFRRGEGGTWILEPSVEGEQVVLQSIGVSFGVDALYASSTGRAE